MTAARQTVQFADEGEAADLAAFLSRLIHYDRAAAVRLQASRATLAVFGRPPSFEVLAIRAARLAKPYENGLDDTLDVTVSAGDLLESVDERAATATVPDPVTGPPWAGVLPPRGGWRPEPGLPGPGALRSLVAGVVAEFRARSERLAAERRTRAELDRIGQDIWSRSVGDTPLPVRAAHAAHALGFLRAARPDDQRSQRRQAAERGRDALTGSTSGVSGARESGAGRSGAREAGASVTSGAGGSGPDAEPVALFAAGSWLRLRTPYGSVAVRKSGTGTLNLTPT